jgi:hypothetical protein
VLGTTILVSPSSTFVAEIVIPAIHIRPIGVPIRVNPFYIPIITRHDTSCFIAPICMSRSIILVMIVTSVPYIINVICKIYKRGI